MLQASDLCGAFAIIPSPALAGADRYGASETIDINETGRLVSSLLEDGVSGLIALGTTGECATLSNADYETFARCLVEAVDGRVPLFIGTSALAGQEVLRRMRFLTTLGCPGTLLGPPMWQPVTDQIAIDFYRELGELVPALAIMVYANQRVFRHPFGDAFWRGVVASCPTVMAAKYLRPTSLESLLQLVGDRVHILPSDMTMAEFYRISPSTTKACWSTAACMGPSPVVRLAAACACDDYTAMAAADRAIAWANEPLLEILRDGDAFASHNIQIEKVRMATAGYCRPGPIRPPYNHLPENLRAAAHACGERWRTIC